METRPGTSLVHPSVMICRVCAVVLWLGTSVSVLPEEAPAFLGELLRNDEKLREVSLGALVKTATGKKVLPFDPDNPVHRELLEGIKTACAAAIKHLNEPGSPLQAEKRINEASRHFEDFLLQTLKAKEGWDCRIPTRPDGVEQRSGYPDLRLSHVASGTVFYLDPKVFHESSRESTFRTFYFEPNESTNKIQDDAVHLLLGFAHDGKAAPWKFKRYEIVDLSHLVLRLKAEFQASNKDIYNPKAILGGE